MYRLFRRRIALFLSLSLIVSLIVPVGSSAFADNEIPPVQSEGPEPVTLVSQGGESLEFTDINVAGDTVEGKMIIWRCIPAAQRLQVPYIPMRYGCLRFMLRSLWMPAVKCWTFSDRTSILRLLGIRERCFQFRPVVTL